MGGEREGMSRVDRDPDRAGAGERLRAVFRRIFGDAENPLSWAVPIGRVADIAIKLHLLFIVYAIGQVLWSIRGGAAGMAYTAMAMGALFALVLLHEFGHCFACRFVKGEADEIILWPLGGLAMCAPPDTWRAHLVTAAGGPLVNVVIFPVTALALLLAGHPEAILFNPFDPLIAVGMFGDYATIALWWLHYINLLLLGFNVLLPMYPMDGGRILHAILWRSRGKRSATDITTITGYVAAGVAGVFGIVTNETLLLAIAAFGALVCYRERQIMRLEDDLSYDRISETYDLRADEEPPARGREDDEKRRLREEREQEEVDRILAKIARSGMDSLSRGERKALKRATKRRRDG
jgi:Zn-dependent protease